MDRVEHRYSLTDAQALRSKGEPYRDYQKRVSRFIPWTSRVPKG